MRIQPQLIDALRMALAEVGGESIRVVDDAMFLGPSPWSDEPVVVLTIEAETPVIGRKQLHEAAWSAFPDLAGEQTTAPDSPVDTVGIAQCAAAIAARLLSKGLRLPRQAGVAPEADGRAGLWIEHVTGGPALQALATALVAAAAALMVPAAPFPARHRALLDRLCADQRPNYQAKILMTAARARHIPFLPVASDPNLWQFGWGCHGVTFWESASNADGMVAWHMARHKHVAKRLLRELGLPTPAARIVRAGDDPVPAGRAVGWPCVVKPADQGSGRGVSTGLASDSDLMRAVQLARRFSATVLVEAHLPGDDHRLLVVDGRLVAAARRVPPSLVGDGKARLGDLLARFNAARGGGREDGQYLVPVKLDAALAATLAQQEFDLNSVAEAGRIVLLRSNANRSTGGTAHDVLDQVHPEVRTMAEEIAATFGFRTTGIDYVSPDIGRSPAEAGGGFIEVNETPDLVVHLAAGMDEATIGSLILGERPARIPVELVIAPKSDQHRLAAQSAQAVSNSLGWATVGPDWARLGGAAMPTPGFDGWLAVGAALRRRAVERLTIVTDVDRLCRFGLPVDHLDRTVLIGAELPPEWQALVERSSERVHRVYEATAAFAALPAPEAGIGADKAKHGAGTA